MDDRELMQQALEALEHIIYWDNEKPEWEYAHAAITALRSRLAQPNEFNPDWDAMAVMVAEQQRIAKRIEELEAQLGQEPVGKVSDQQCRRLLYGFMLDFNAVGFEQAGRNLHRAMKEAAHGIKGEA
jgi:hypothetical protein